MDKKLKLFIKECVRESLLEIFAEMHLETIVENVLKQRKNNLQPVIVETKKVEVTKPKIDIQAKLKQLEIKDDIWANIYADTAKRNSPLLTEQGNAAATPSPPEISEKVLENTGLLKDYSAFIPNSKKIDTGTDDWDERRKQYEQTMASMRK